MVLFLEKEPCGAKNLSGAKILAERHEQFSLDMVNDISKIAALARNDKNNFKNKWSKNLFLKLKNR